MNSRAPSSLVSTFLRLRPDSSIEQLAFDDSFWPGLMSGKLGTFHHEYLVTTSSFREDWPNWERHTNGDEIVCLLSGAVTFVFERENGNEEVSLGDVGEFVFVPQGVWHTARTSVPTLMLFITAGEGTEGRPAMPPAARELSS
ncbi:MAG: cupin domain-containing protein [Pseudomonadota bacterium]